MENILQVKDLETKFHTKKGVIRAVDHVSFEVGKGKVIGLVGESGCGKSMTALSIMGLVPSPPGEVTASEILLNQRDIAKLSHSVLCNIRGKEISMIFQEPMTSLNPVYTVGRQVGEAVSIHQKNVGKAEIRERVVETFDLVGIPEPASRFGAYPHQLSGGLRQRVMIAMALICKPELLIADEPTTALDVTIQSQILSLMMGLRERLHTSIIMITHDLGVIAEVCDHVNVMYAGKIVETANVFDLFDKPSHPYTRGLLRSIPSVTEQGRRKHLDSIRGIVPNLLYLPNGCSFNPRCDKALDICRQEKPEFFDLGGGHHVSCWLHEKQGEANDSAVD